jgi:tetratricopeptide (TPR) repeat protein
MTSELMKYNPAFLPDEVLIRSFVARTSELERILEVLRENTAEANQHLLVIGPRGIGKTTLVLRTAAEIRVDPTLGARWYPIVFGEETYQVSSPGELWLEALFHLGEQTGEARWKGAYEELRRERDEERLRHRALAQLMDFADEQGKRLVLVVENLNMLFQGQLSSEDAWVLRQPLLNEPRLMLLATATSRFREIDEYNQALYELFRIIELEPLAEGEAQALWTAATGQDAPSHQMRPLQILTGGNPRLLRILSAFAARTSFRSLMEELTRLVDEHTEYFKHHLDSLAPQERKVFVVLADLWDPVTARQVAEEARLDVNVASAQLKRLVERGAVTAPYKRGRAQYYQVAERMYNIYHLMRRRGPAASRVHAAVRFMVSLYRNEDLVRTTRSLAEEAARLTADQRREHFLAYEAILSHVRESKLAERLIEAAREAFEALPDVPTSVLRLIDPGAFLQDIATGSSPPDETPATGHDMEGVDDVRTLLRIADQLASLPERANDAEAAYRQILNVVPDSLEGWLGIGELQFRGDRYDEALESYDRAVSVDAQRAFAWTMRGMMLGYLERVEEALESFDRAISVDAAYAYAWTERGRTLGQHGRMEEALESLDHAVSIDATDAYAWVERGRTLSQLGRVEEALESFDHAASVDAAYAYAWMQRGITAGKFGRVDEALESFDRAVSVDAENARAWMLRGIGLGQLGRVEEALESLDRALALDPEIAVGWYARGEALGRLGRAEEALVAFERGLALDAGSERPASATSGALAFNMMADTVFKHGLQNRIAAAEEWARRAVGEEPDEGAFRHTLACILGVQGKWGEALGEAAIFLRDRRLLEDSLDEVLDFFVDAVASGNRESVLKVIHATGTEDALEPLIVAIRRLAGEQVDVAREILSCVIFIEQNFGPHMEQKCAIFAPSAGSVSSWYASAVTGSSDRLNWSRQRNSKRALLRASSHCCARGWPLARSAAWAAIRYVITPCFTSSRFGSPRCSLGVT